MKLDGNQKLVLKNKVKYLYARIEMMGQKITERDYKKLKDFEFKLENNLPIKKQMLYELAPDLFTFQIQDLTEIEQDRIKKNAINLEFKEEDGF